MKIPFDLSVKVFRTETRHNVLQCVQQVN